MFSTFLSHFSVTSDQTAELAVAQEKLSTLQQRLTADETHLEELEQHQEGKGSIKEEAANAVCRIRPLRLDEISQQYNPWQKFRRTQRTGPRFRDKTIGLYIGNISLLPY